MLLGLRTVIYKVSDLERAKNWYRDVLNTQPYFDQPFYVGFNIGGFELGLDPDVSGFIAGNNLCVYWGVKNVPETFEELLKKGAKVHSEPQTVGKEIVVASVFDPFENIFGIIENPEFKIENIE
ncbi:MAG: VOC family protein [Acidobacteria bacterium]|nr:VOC family protein [Acidobacteriota bacterium]